jgi:hypothetical protein
MKRLLLLLAIVALFACNDESTEGAASSHEQQWSADGKDSVVYVRYKDDNGNWVNFYMQYLLFNSLFNSGGYNACYNHYHSNPAQYYNVSHYSSYRPRANVSEPPATGHHVIKSNSSPSRSSWSSGSSSSSSSSKSSSSPSRSSSSSSYSSPSRSSGSSYSSPSRSYSSPSRSYSSPSRSYSSPSRH